MSTEIQKALAEAWDTPTACSESSLKYWHDYKARIVEELEAEGVSYEAALQEAIDSLAELPNEFNQRSVGSRTYFVSKEHGVGIPGVTHPKT